MLNVTRWHWFLVGVACCVFAPFAWYAMYEYARISEERYNIAIVNWIPVVTGTLFTAIAQALLSQPPTPKSVFTAMLFLCLAAVSWYLAAAQHWEWLYYITGRKPNLQYKVLSLLLLYFVVPKAWQEIGKEF